MKDLEPLCGQLDLTICSHTRKQLVQAKRAIHTAADSPLRPTASKSQKPHRTKPFIVAFVAGKSSIPNQRIENDKVFHCEFQKKTDSEQTSALKIWPNCRWSRINFGPLFAVAGRSIILTARQSWLVNSLGRSTKQFCTIKFVTNYFWPK